MWKELFRLYPRLLAATQNARRMGIFGIAVTATAQLRLNGLRLYLNSRLLKSSILSIQRTIPRQDL